MERRNYMNDPQALLHLSKILAEVKADCEQQKEWSDYWHNEYRCVKRRLEQLESLLSPPAPQ